MPFQCNECGAQFSKMNLLQQHQRTLGHRNIYVCDICHKWFGRADNLKRHCAKHQDATKYHCEVCGKCFSREDNLLRHQSSHHIQQGGAAPDSEDKENEPPRKRFKMDMPNKHYDIKVLKETEMPKFRTKSTQYRVTFQDIEVRDIPEILKTLKRLFRSIIGDVTQYMEPADLIRMSLQSPDLDYPIALPFMKVDELSPQRLLSEIERVLQSFEEFTLDDNIEIDLVHVSLPRGGVGKRCKYIDLEKMVRDKRCFIRIVNKDDLCCARALVTAKARMENHEKWNSIRTGCKIQEILAKELHRTANVPLDKCGLEEIKKFQEVMHDYQINVLSKEQFNALIFSGPDNRVPLYLYQHDNHYDVITSMPAFLSKNYFCSKCKMGYDRKAEHTCNNCCLLCRNVHDDEGEEQWMSCTKCNRSFKNATCYRLHLEKRDRGGTTCETLYKCAKCDQLVNRRIHSKPHQCGESYCNTCKEFVSDGHECFMQTTELEESKTKDSENETPKTFIYFDFECTQEKLQQCTSGYQPLSPGGKCVNCKRSSCGSYVHEPNLCVVHKVCERCEDMNIDENSNCDYCGPNEHIFEGDDAVSTFCKWLFSDQNHGAKVLCHNFKGYDSFPILKYLYENGILPEVITTGTKYLSVDVPKCNMRFLDSLNFLPMALAELPEAFGFTELCKGFFPHLYNKRENWNSHLHGLPDLKFYNPDGMKPKMRESFLKWYEKHRSDTFIFQRELLKYCKSDVDILRRSCTAFRRLFMEITTTEGHRGIDPFERCITIASACNLVFRSLFLKEDSIGVIPPHGYRPQYKQSIKAMKWIKYLSEARQVEITHAFNGGEKLIGPYHVDGYYESDGEKVVLEFHGDFWHGCPKCYSGNTVNPVTNTTMSDLYQQTQDKRKYIEQKGYKYECLWECEFEKELKQNEKMKQIIDSVNISPPLEPRDAFYGGRTEAFKLYASSDQSTRIKYYDVTSLYPFINKTGKIPIGHPEIITEDFKDVESYEGLIKCTILPPKGLHIPVLPYRANNKLLFPLCRTCAEQRQTTPCMHSEQERAIEGTWVSDEIKQALKQGYIVQRIDEVWHFSNVSQYDPEAMTGGLFTEYVNTFLKIKQEASGWPSWCTNDTLKQMYIDDYFKREGILLDASKIQKNPGLRRLAKLMLNSFWGKFGQRGNLVQNKYISNPLEYFEMFTRDNIEIKNVKFVSDNMVQMDWIYEKEFIQTSDRTNVVIAAYTTAQARLKLFQYLDHLKERAIYCDTDSIVFSVGEGDKDLPLGDYLGELTDEVAEHDIVTFVTGGPKNYAYTMKHKKTNNISTCCKVRGITLNYKNALDINFDTVRDMVTGVKKVVSVIDDYKICRDVHTGNVITKTEKKDYKLVFDKRVLCENYETKPYGM